MAPMITAERTMRGKPNYRDNNYFSYFFNGKREETKKWRCSKRTPLSLRGYWNQQHAGVIKQNLEQFVWLQPNVFAIQELFVKQDADCLG